MFSWLMVILLSGSTGAKYLPDDSGAGVTPGQWAGIALGRELARSAWQTFIGQWDPSSRKVLVVSLNEQRLYLFREKVLLAVFVVSTGRNNYTPKGRFRIYYKKAKVRYTSGEGMDYWMEFRRNYGVHGLPVDADGNESGADELGTPASAGCVRLDTSQARLLFRVVPTGSVIIIQDDPPRSAR